jgi:hypothetical protein
MRLLRTSASAFFVIVETSCPSSSMAGRGSIQAADDVHEGRLAGSRRPGDGEEFTARHVDIDARSAAPGGRR